MKKSNPIIIIIFVLLNNYSQAQQSFSGIKAGNLSGVLGATANPANLADNHYKWDVNLGSANQHFCLYHPRLDKRNEWRVVQLCFGIF